MERRVDWARRLADRISRWRTFLALEPRAKATGDFETRSACNLKRHGAYLYSLHPTTEAMVLRYKLPGEDVVRTWHMAHPQHLISESPPPEELFAFLLAGGLFEAHNAFFERCVWTNVMVARHGWPAVEPTQWRCSAAKACAASLPRDLEGAGTAMCLSQQKDMAGHRLMKKMCKPRKPRKAEVEAWVEETGFEGTLAAAKGAMPLLWHEEEDDLYRLWEYCGDDVLSEEALSDAVPDLSEPELAVWQMDQEMNWRGVRFDLELAESALWVAAEWRKRLNDELFAMTGVTSGTLRIQVKAWLSEAEDLQIPDTKAETLEWYLEREEISGRARRVMEIVIDVNRTSTRKYQQMLDKCLRDDWRARDLLMYHGAGPGRWTGKGIQVHNFPARKLIVKDFEEAAEAIKSRNIDWCVALFGDVMKLLSHALRGAIIPDEGRDLMVADYAAIEARCVLWEAGATEALKIFNSGGDIYCDMATGIYGYRVTKKSHPSERQFGKQAILGLGYGMGFITFLLTCRKYKIHFARPDCVRIMGEERLRKYEGWVRRYLRLDPEVAGPRNVTRDANGHRQASRARRRLTDAREDPWGIVHELALMKYTVDVYRSRYPEVKQMWKDQESAAIRAVREWQDRVRIERKRALAQRGADDEVSFSAMEHETVQWRDHIGGPRIECGRVAWEVVGGWLHCWLPSGRPIRYRDPQIKMAMTSWGERRPALRYMSVNGVTRKWERTATYGGKIVENITQAVARDVMAVAMMNANEPGSPYDTVMSVHDELVCEVDHNEGSIEDFEALMSFVPPWAHGCPIAAEAERMGRYKK